MNRTKAIAVAALVALLGTSGCSLMSPKLDFSDPMVIVYTTRLGVAQTADVVTAGVEQGLISKEKGAQIAVELHRAAAALDVAESAINARQDATDELDEAIKILTAVRNDPSLTTVLAKDSQ